MVKKLSASLLFACFFFLVSTMAQAQCGSYIEETTLSCGSCGGSFVRQLCQGVGDFCEDGTGDLTFGCCGLMLFLPGSCQSAKAAPRKELLPSEEFLAFREALAVRKRLFPSREQLTIASCAPDKNAFNEWLQAKLRQQQQRQ